MPVLCQAAGKRIYRRRLVIPAICLLISEPVSEQDQHTNQRADVPPGMIADKLIMFLRQHPYTPALVVNVINPGDAGLILAALLDVESRRSQDDPPMRYLVRMFSDAPQREEIASAFRDLLDPERQISEASDRLIGPGGSLLFPRLSWSRSRLTDFLEHSEDFPAHVTILQDAFRVGMRLSRQIGEDRSSFVHGLIQQVPRRFTGRGRSMSWVCRPMPRPCTEIPQAPGRSALLAEVLELMLSQQAKALAPMAETRDTVAVAALDLSSADQALLYSAHSASAWVLTLDQHLGLDYFDTARGPDRPGYLLDFTPEFTASGGRRLLLTTRIGDEVVQLMKPGVAQLQLDSEELAADLLIEALRSLSGRLALRFLSAPSQVQGALGMALSRLFLEAYGLLSDVLVIPLDAHPELATHGDPNSPKLRGDLLIVSADPVHRRLDFLLVETKCHSGSGLSADLRATIAAQLDSSMDSLRQAFDQRSNILTELIELFKVGN